MRLKTALTFLAFVVIAWQVQAQTQPEMPLQPAPHLIQFEETTHDFGIQEQGAKTETVFKFKNISSAPLHLTAVKASCGCTTPDWSKEEIAPGGQGEIKVTYNSQRVGPFNKSVAVTYNDRPDPMNVYIKGEIKATTPKEGEEKNVVAPVVAQPAAQPAINYSIIRGSLAFEKVIENVKSFTSEENPEAEFRFKNTASVPVKIFTDKTESTPDVTVMFKDEVLQPGQETTVKLKVNGKKMKEGGQVDNYIARNVAFYTDESGINKKELTINGNFKRVFTEEEMANTPTIEFVVKSIEGGKIIEGENYVYDFAFKNTGKAPLKILAAKASCGCTAISPVAESIAPGETGAITATFNSKGRVGMQSKSITVTTNDIQNPTVGLRFTVEVVKDPFHAGGVVEQQ